MAARLLPAQALLSQAEQTAAYHAQQRELYPLPEKVPEGEEESASEAAERERAQQIHAAADAAAAQARTAQGNVEAAQVGW